MSLIAEKFDEFLNLCNDPKFSKILLGEFNNSNNELDDITTKYSLHNYNKRNNKINLRDYSEKIKDQNENKIYRWNLAFIPHDSRWKNIFDIFALFMIVYSGITTLFNTSFNDDDICPNLIDINEKRPKPEIFQKFDLFVEFVLGLSIIFKFLQHVETKNKLIIKSFKKIALNYIFKSTFLIDFISIFPFQLIIGQNNSTLFKLIRLLRLPKLFAILDIDRFDTHINRIFSLYNSDGFGDKDKSILIFNIKYVYKVIRLIFIAIILTYFLGCIWYLLCSKLSIDCYDKENNFIMKYKLLYKTDFGRLLISCYFVLTTLVTVGFGDYVPLNTTERILVIFIIVLGVALFSYIMSNFTELITSYDKIIGLTDKASDLQNWLTCMHLENSYKIDSNLIKKIDRHFTYFWQKNRISHIKIDDPYYISLPKNLKIDLINFFWEDIFKEISFFNYENKNNVKRFFKFYNHIAFNLLPRKYYKDELIYEKYQEIEEMYFFISGNIKIGYSLNSDKSGIEYCIDKSNIIGEYYCLFNKITNYYYKVDIEFIETFALSKNDLNIALKYYPNLYKRCMEQIEKNYKNNIFDIMEANSSKKIDLLNKNNRDIILQKVNNIDGETKIKSTKNIFSNKINEKYEQIEKTKIDIIKKMDNLINMYNSIDDDFKIVKSELDNKIKDLSEKLNQININIKNDLSNETLYILK